MLHQSAAVVESDPFGVDYSQGLPTLGQEPAIAPAQVVIRAPNIPLVIASIVLVGASLAIDLASLKNGSKAALVTSRVMRTAGLICIPLSFAVGNR